MHRAVVLALVACRHVVHDHAMRLVLLLYLAYLQVVFCYLRVTFLVRGAVLGAWGHDLQVLLVVHRRVQLVVAARCSSEDLHILHASTQMLKLAAAVHVVAAVDGIVGAHALNDEAVLDDLVHIRLLPVQALLYLVIRLLHQPGMLVEVHARQVVVRLLREGALLRRGLDHSPVVLTLLEHIVLLLVLVVRWRLFHGQFVRCLLHQDVV